VIAIGVDPGKAGGMVAIRPDRSVLLAIAADGPDGYHLDNEIDPVWLSGLLAPLRGLPCCAVIERPTVQPPTGRTSCLTIGIGYGLLAATLRLAGIPLVEVSPAQWSRAMLGAPPAGGWAGKAKKEAAMALCSRELPALRLVLPGRKVRHDGLADAGALALYALRTAYNAN
jgi:hypothetical protein